MSISKGNRRQLEFLRDIYEVSASCSTKTYIWGGLTIDIFEGRFLREHGAVDAFTADLLERMGELTRLYEERGYRTEFRDEWHMFEVWKDDFHAGFNRLETDHGIAMWRHIGEHGTVYFPSAWLDDVPRAFYDVQVYTSGIQFEYAIKTNVRLLSPEWQPRQKDIEAAQYLARALQDQGLDEEDVLRHIWSYSPYWTRKGYEEYAMPSVAWTLLPDHAGG